jgi:hypothetical protein
MGSNKTGVRTIIFGMNLEKVKGLLFTTQQVAQLLGIRMGTMRERTRKLFALADKYKARRWTWADVLKAEEYFGKHPVKQFKK